MAGFSKAQPSAPAACCDRRILHTDKCRRGGVRQTPSLEEAGTTQIAIFRALA